MRSQELKGFGLVVKPAVGSGSIAGKQIPADGRPADTCEPAQLRFRDSVRVLFLGLHRSEKEKLGNGGDQCGQGLPVIIYRESCRPSFSIIPTEASLPAVPPTPRRCACALSNDGGRTAAGLVTPLVGRAW